MAAGTDAKAVGKALRPRARILRTLGEELISSETVAVIELVKNAYDADAGSVVVRFEGSLSEGSGSVSVEDDGHGMTLGVIEKAWMEPATNLKKKTKVSRFLRRRLLGEKGVGRFAAARLAADLELCTRAAGEASEVYGYFDWSQFDNEDAYLDEVLILAEEREPVEFLRGRSVLGSSPSGVSELPRDGTHGTLLRMNKLKRGWGDTEILDLRRGLSRLISPFEASRDFKILMLLPGQAVSEATEVEPPEIIKYPHYAMSGVLGADGKFELAINLYAAGEEQKLSGYLRRESLDSPLSESDGSNVGSGVPLVCGPLSFHILVWDRDQLDNVNQKLGTGIRSIRRDLDSVAGVSIYRDGFRVLPYGEPENDWLKLDLRRVQNPTLRLSNNQITGYIRIGADSNPLLKDQSNREGLDNNRAYADLQGFMKFSLAKLEQLRFKQKQRAPSDERSDGAHSLLDPPNTDALREKLSSLGSTEALELLDDVDEAWASQIVKVREVLSRYHSLATLGQLVDKVIHDGRQPLATLQTQASLADEAIAKASTGQLENRCRELLTSLGERVGKIRNAAGLIDLLLRRIEPLGGRRKGRPTKVYLKEIVKSALSHFGQDIDSLGVRVELPEEDDLIQVDDLELQEVLINLAANSIFWLKEVPKSQRAIVVQWSRPSPGALDIVFADSGPGVPKSNRAAIFEPYFSTKPDGVGLGLVIAGEIVKDYYDGSLELLDAGPLPGAAFRIRLRKRV